ncbi:hypothetical protein CMUS01_07824 [Colletotrichum musicola]|uniref:Uncharacterized protein n=1 Tax=Colletotrichum musicola TaxID=2175873 RepID=A0A8H6KFW7_9PEZI|nr:hypothetical protein CMUS01_07824 [Colletotrichum musicola]
MGARWDTHSSGPKRSIAPSQGKGQGSKQWREKEGPPRGPNELSYSDASGNSRGAAGAQGQEWKDAGHWSRHIHIDVDMNTIAPSFNIIIIIIIIIIITTVSTSSSSQLAPSWCDLHFSSSDSIPNRNPDTAGETETDVSHLLSYSPTALIALITREARRAPCSSSPVPALPLHTLLRIATRWTTDPSVRNSLLSTSDLEPLGILHVHVVSPVVRLNLRMLTTIPSVPTPMYGRAEFVYPRVAVVFAQLRLRPFSFQPLRPRLVTVPATGKSDCSTSRPIAAAPGIPTKTFPAMCHRCKDARGALER